MRWFSSLQSAWLVPQVGIGTPGETGILWHQVAEKSRHKRSVTFHPFFVVYDMDYDKPNMDHDGVFPPCRHNAEKQQTAKGDIQDTPTELEFAKQTLILRSWRKKHKQPVCWKMKQENVIRIRAEEQHEVGRKSAYCLNNWRWSPVLALTRHQIKPSALSWTMSRGSPSPLLIPYLCLIYRRTWSRRHGSRIYGLW